jgi:hypothetical protein
MAGIPIPRPGTQTLKPETGNRTPKTGNGVPAGPLAQAVRGGANVGVVERSPLPEAANAEPLAEGPRTPISAPDVVKEQMRAMFSSPNLDARLKALKMAQHIATPDMAGSIAEAALVDAGLKESIIKFVKQTELFRQRQEAILQKKQQQQHHSPDRLDDRETDQLVSEVCNVILAPLTKQAGDLLSVLYAKDPVATVDSLAPVYHRRQNVVSVQQWGLATTDAIKLSCELIDAALLGIKKDPCLLKLADRLIDDNAFDDAANLIAKIGLPEGAERLGVLVQKAGGQLAENQRLGSVFLAACAVVGTPECLPLLDAVRANPNLHEQMLETAAKILNIELA